MRKLLFTILILTLSLSALPALAAVKKTPAKKAPVPPFVLSSPAFKDGAEIPVEYGCNGANTSPTLKISGVPKGTKSLALIMDDPDAKQVVGKTWVHWTLWNIKPDTKEIPAGKVPKGAVQGTTSFDSTGYGGPCPPAGTHRYFFKLYALKVQRLNLKPTATEAALVKAMKGKILKEAKLLGRYSALPTEASTPAPVPSSTPAPATPSPSLTPTLDY